MASYASVTILGTRGTIAAAGAQFCRYGGGTPSFLVRLGGECIVLDAGTGILDLSTALHGGEDRVTILLSHPHADHLSGLTTCDILFNPAYTVALLATPKGGRSAREQVCTYMSPPIWPVGPEAFSAQVSFRDLEDSPFPLGAVRVETMAGRHPGGCTVFRLSYGGASLVYATDYELTDDSAPALGDFARDCSLLLCDGQYTDEEYASLRGFGHSSWRAAAQLALDCGAGALRIIHHAPRRTDEALDTMTPALEALFPGAAFARAGEEVTFG